MRCHRYISHLLSWYQIQPKKFLPTLTTTMSTPTNKTIAEIQARVLLEQENRLRVEREMAEREEWELHELEEAEAEEKQKEEAQRLVEEVEKKEREEKERREKKEKEKAEAAKKKKEEADTKKRKEEEAKKKRAEVEEEEEDEEEGRGLPVEEWMEVTRRMREDGLREAQERAKRERALSRGAKGRLRRPKAGSDGGTMLELQVTGAPVDLCVVNISAFLFFIFSY